MHSLTYNSSEQIFKGLLNKIKMNLLYVQLFSLNTVLYLSVSHSNTLRQSDVFKLN